jgi:hypothetical protein
MKKILLTEKQLKIIIEKNLLSEDKLGDYSNIEAGTNKTSVSHLRLNELHGLPSGNYENFTFKSTIGEMLEISKTGNETTYLSIFKPYQNINKYDDLISIAGKSYSAGNPKDDINKTTTTYRPGTFFSNVLSASDMVIASHNGLLALVRVMKRMNQSQKIPRTIQITFGSNFEDKDQTKADEERFSQIVNVKIPDSAYNIIPEMYTVAQLLICYMDTQNKSPFCQPIRNKLYETTVNFFNRVFNNAKFLPQKNIEQIKEFLIPKGYITTIDFPEIKQIFSKILENIGNMSKTTDSNFEAYNKNVVDQTLRSIDDLVIKVQEKIIKAYFKNLKLYLDNYFPQDQEELSKYNSLKYKIVPAFDAYKKLFAVEVNRTTQDSGSFTKEREKLPQIGN